METKEAARRLETDEKQGLTSQMAAERLAQKGRNELAETDGKKSLFWRFLAQFDDFMILLLLGAAVVSAIIALLSKNTFARLHQQMAGPPAAQPRPAGR